MRDLTRGEVHVLRHSLDTGEHGRKPGHRNHFVTGEGSKDHPTCMQLVELGLMQRRPGNALSGGDDVFYVTDSGRAVESGQQEAEPPMPKLTRGQQRYREYMRSEPNCSFGEWLGLRSRTEARCWKRAREAKAAISHA